MNRIFGILAIGWSFISVAQTPAATALDTVKVFGKLPYSTTLPEQQQGVLYAGKKTQAINLGNRPMPAATNPIRQALAAVPGLSVWESDGSGVQINIGFRGLSPNRSWELNTRQNGYDMAADAFGYPEAYYNPPLEAVESVQLVRGGSSLAFGPQIGGMVNYVLKRETQKPFSVESNTTAGAFNLLSNFTALGGQRGKWSFYAYHHYRKGEGWRANNAYDVRHVHAYVGYQWSPKHQLTAEYTRMDYNTQQPGGLTDAQFADNARQSLRSRNWFNVPWNIAHLKWTAQWTPRWQSWFGVTGLWAARNSVGNTSAITTLDAIDPNTLQYSPRRVDIDRYENLTFENRNLYRFKWGQNTCDWAFGVRAYQAHTNRLQKGVGSTGTDNDYAVVNDFFKTALDFRTQNAAVFTEWTLRPHKAWRVVPGLRWEYVRATGNGYIESSTPWANPVGDLSNSRSVLLAGLGVQYQPVQWTYYANVSQSFRPVLFSDLTPAATTDKVDPNLSDAKAVTAEIGARGQWWKALQIDATLFYMQYDNRIGTLTQWVDPVQTTLGTYQYRTNLGRSVHQGVELLAELAWHKIFPSMAQYGQHRLMASLSWIDARYTQLNTQAVSAGVLNAADLQGNRVENAPRYIHTLSWTSQWARWTLTAQCRWNGMVYTDAQNTEKASANAQTGALAGYQVADWAVEWKMTPQWTWRGGMNNAFDQRYATRRSGGYPGPGLLPGEGRSFFVSLGYKM